MIPPHFYIKSTDLSTRDIAIADNASSGSFLAMRIILLAQSNQPPIRVLWFSQVSALFLPVTYQYTGPKLLFKKSRTLSMPILALVSFSKRSLQS